MSIFARVFALSGVVLLGGCSSWSWDWMPSMPGLSSAANVSLTIESDPPGADARTSNGASCRTPCMIPVAADREFTVSYSLPGYLPQTIPVSPRAPVGLIQPEVEAGGALPAADLTPNPVYAQLQPAPPPPPPTRKGRGKAPRAVKKQ